MIDLFSNSFLMQENRYLSIIGICVILGAAFAFSDNKKKIKLKQIVIALGMQFLLAFFILKTAAGKAIFSSIAH